MQDSKKVTLVERVLDILQRSRILLLVIIGVLVVVIVGLIVKNSLNENRLNEAAVALENLDELADSWKSTSDDAKKTEIFAKLQAATESISKAFPTSYYLQRAHFSLATIYFATNQFDKAAAEYLLAVESKKDSIFAGVYLFDAAIAAEQANQNDKSQEYLTRLVAEYKQTTAEVPRALFALGRIAEDKNDFQKASAYYKQMIDDFGSDSDWTKMARDRIIFLKKQQKL